MNFMEWALLEGLRLTRDRLLPFAVRGLWRRRKFAGDMKLWRPEKGTNGEEIK